MKDVLHLTLKKEWFDKILEGTKKTEYRDIKPYWTTRLFDNVGKPRKFNEIFFRNGYGKSARWMKVEFLGIKKSEERYKILLGAVLKSGN